MLLAVLTRKSSRQTCGPMPTVAPDASLPGLVLAYCTSSCSVRRDRRVHHQRIGVECDQTDRGEVLDRFEVERPIERGDGVGIGAAQQQRVAIRAGVRHELGAGASAAARLVFDDDALPKSRGERLRHEARRHVGRAGRRIGHDDLDQAVGVGLGAGKTRARETDGDGDGCGEENSFRAHRCPVKFRRKERRSKPTHSAE
jgi:hypothetical protein